MKQVVVIGGGVAGMEAAAQLTNLGIQVTLLEKEQLLGGKLNNWHQLFPDRKPANVLLHDLKHNIANKIDVHFSAEVYKLENNNNEKIVHLTDGQQFNAHAVLVATGYDLFDARKKEEYGYGIYDNVLTSADLEKVFKTNEILKTSNGTQPSKIAFIHCVGSRDEKVGNTHCSKVCCVTGVKQAIELKQMLPESEIFCFYMDLRMFDRYFEDLYLEAQVKYGINFIRGRLSEAAENIDGSLVLKAEDTLTGRPLRLTVDTMVLLAGITGARNTLEVAMRLGIKLASDKFILNADNHANTNLTSQKGVFCCGCCTGPRSVAETLTDARSAVLKIVEYLS